MKSIQEKLFVLSTGFVVAFYGTGLNVEARSNDENIKEENSFEPSEKLEKYDPSQNGKKEEEEKVGFELNGYARSRFYHSANVPVDPLSSSGDYTETAEYLDTRLKLAPVIKYKDLLKTTIWIHILDDVIWGDNAGLSDMGITASDPSSTGRNGENLPLINIKAAWLQINLKILVFMIGRMPSDWGLGLLTAGSDSLDDDFSWNRGGSVYDRVLVATEPLSVILTIAKAPLKRVPLIFAYCYDQIVEDDISVGKTRLPYSSQWLTENTDDVKSHNFVLEYKWENMGIFSSNDMLEAGAYLVKRNQKATFSDLSIFDYFWKIRLGHPELYGFSEGEIYAIRGSTMAIPLGDHPQQSWCEQKGYPRCPDWLYDKKNVRIHAWLMRLGFFWKPVKNAGFTFKIESGFASGDSNPGNRTFTVMPAHSDLKVGLVLYDIILNELTRLNWADKSGFWSRGGIYNSYYILFLTKLTIFNNIDILLQCISAWPDKPDGVIIRVSSSDSNKRESMGVEFDAGIRLRFYKNHGLIGLEGGFLKAGAALERKDLNGAEIYPEFPWTIQFWSAYLF